MNKVITIILALSIGIAGYSQESSREKVRSEVKQYLETAVYPVIKQQQENYISKLTETEKSDLDKITLSSPNSGNRNSGNRGRGKGRNGNPPQQRVNSTECVASITQAHPDLNEEYTKIILTYQQKWISDIEEIHKEYDIEPVKNTDNKRGFDMFFERISSPEKLLLWDTEKPLPRNQRGAKKKVGKQRTHFGQNTNSELKSAMKIFLNENVLPVIAEERQKFDVNLDDSEREIIEIAQQKILVRKTMFRSWYESEDFVPGQRATDPAFNDMREDMRSSMKQVREIALAHDAEIKSSMESIKENKEEWLNKVRAIHDKYGDNSDKMNHRKMKWIKSPVSFLLFDPDKADKSSYLDMDNDIMVVIYPNPIVNSGTIAVTGAVGSSLNISMYSKNGEKIKELYNSINMEERLEVTVSFDGMDNGVYIAKISTGDMEISRKLIVQK